MRGIGPKACLLAAALCTAMAGCASGGAPSWNWFAPPGETDYWAVPISGWQARAVTEQPDGWEAAPGPLDDALATPPTTALAASFDRFRSSAQRSLAREATGWIQAQAREHFTPDGVVDRWATFAETLASGSDDCDGLAAVAQQLLLELGFAPDALYLGIVRRDSDGQHHMVTLWFEDPRDPWVIDPTAAMVSGFVRMSEVEGWRPLRLFRHDADFEVRPAGEPLPASLEPGDRSASAPSR